jgi:hypothetical protein
MTAVNRRLRRQPIPPVKFPWDVALVWLFVLSGVVYIAVSVVRALVA